MGIGTWILALAIVTGPWWLRGQTATMVSGAVSPSPVVRVVHVGAGPVDVAVDDTTGMALVVSAHTNTVRVLNAYRGTVLHIIPVGKNPQSVALDHQTGRAFVANAGANTVSIIGLQTWRVIGTVPVGAQPIEVRADALTHRAFGINNVGHSVSVLETHTGRLVTTHKLGFMPLDLAVAGLTARVFILGHVSTSSTTMVGVLDATSGRLVQTTRAGSNAFLVTNSDNLAVDETLKRVFIVNSDGGTISVLNSLTGAVEQTIPVNQPISVAIDPRVHRAIVTQGTKPGVEIFDVRRGALIRSVAVPMLPLTLGVDAQAGHAVIVTNDMVHKSIVLLDTHLGTVIRTLATPYAIDTTVADTHIHRAFLIDGDSDTVTLVDTAWPR